MDQKSANYKEGKAVIAAGNAFLNPESRFSRDVSIAFASMVSKKGTRILDATTATGLRGIRYYKETKAKQREKIAENLSAEITEEWMHSGSSIEYDEMYEVEKEQDRRKLISYIKARAKNGKFTVPKPAKMGNRLQELMKLVQKGNRYGL